MKRTRKKASMAVDLPNTSWVGQAWGKDTVKMRRINRARRKELARKEICDAA